MADSKSPPPKVYFFKHFPRFFFRPYDAQLHYSEKQFVEKLSPKNCELLTRPKISISECAMGILDDFELVKDSSVFSEEFLASLKNVIEDIIPSLHNLNTKNKDASPSAQDVYNILHSCCQSSTFDEEVGKAHQQVAAMYTMLAQLRALRGLVRNPKLYAEKIVDDSISSVEFKTEKALSALQRMLQELCVPACQTRPTTTQTMDLAAQLVNPSATGASVQACIRTV